MKFKIDKAGIISEFQSLAAVADKKQTLPILSNILIRCEADSIKLLSTDLEVELEVCLSGANICLLYTSPSPRDNRTSRMPSSA